MIIFAPIYYSYLALIDSCMHMHFLNSYFLGQILNPRVICFLGGESMSRCITDLIVQMT